jgi:hypothetical protein
MISKFKDLLSLRQELDALQTSFEDQLVLCYRTLRAEIAEQVRKANADMATALAADKKAKAERIAAERSSKKNGPAPWVEIQSDSYDSDKGLGLQLDWNDAFIKELRSKGFTGITDYAIVNSWLVALHRQMSEGTGNSTEYE